MKYACYSLAVAIIVGIGVAVSKALQLDFEGLFVNYALEVATLLIGLLLIAILVFCDIYLCLTAKKRSEILRLQNEKNSYKEGLEKLTKVDAEAQQLRAIIQHRKDNDNVDNGVPR